MSGAVHWLSFSLKNSYKLYNNTFSKTTEDMRSFGWNVVIGDLQQEVGEVCNIKR